MIVLDAVGAGELPDAAEYGDEGSDTLGNVVGLLEALNGILGLITGLLGGLLP